MKPKSLLSFGGFRLDGENEQLWRRNQQVVLIHKAFSLLRYLVEHPGQLVAKEELLDALWPNVHVSDAVLKVNVRRIRNALGDKAKAPRFIETVHGLGYRFIGQVTEIPGRTFAPRKRKPAAQGRRDPGPAGHRARRKGSLALSFPDKPSLVVLPFINMSGEAAQDAFSDGMTEVVITDLSKLSGLFVISRNSAFTYQGQVVKVAKVCRELGVQYVLEGSIQKTEDRLRIVVQLIDGTNGGHVWAERYDRQLTDLFAIQDEITQQIVSALTIRLISGEAGRLMRRDTENLEAYEYFWRREAIFWKFTEKKNQQAQQLYQRAIALDPQYAAAYAALAHAQYLAWSFQWSTDPQTLDQAFELAHRALAAFSRATVIAPNDSYGHVCLAHLLMHLGQTEEAIREMEQGMRLDPHYPPYYLYYLGYAYYFAGRYEEAVAIHKRVLVRTANLFWPCHLNLAVLYSESGREAEAGAAVEEVLRINPKFSLKVVASRKILYKDSAVFKRELDALRKAGLKG